MNRGEIIDFIAAEGCLSRDKAGAILNGALELIKDAVKRGEDVRLVGFGTFRSAERKARTGRNPSNGSVVKIPATKVPKFIPSASFKKALDL